MKAFNFLGENTIKTTFHYARLQQVLSKLFLIRALMILLSWYNNETSAYVQYNHTTKRDYKFTLDSNNESICGYPVTDLRSFPFILIQ